jgi:hypothetical protein
MSAMRWLDRSHATTDAITARLTDASATLAAALRDANRTLLKNGTAGFDAVRAFGDDLRSDARRMRQSTRSLVVEHPRESALAIALTGAVVGCALYFFLRSRPLRRKTATPAARPHKRRARAVSTSKNSAGS